MQPRAQIDAFGAVALTAFSLLLAFNQVVIAVTNEGFQPVFFAGLRSVGAAVCVALWMRLRGIAFDWRHAPLAGVLCGTLFAMQFLLLFLALDLTTVARTSVVFYTMPVWMALGAHLLLPGERIGGLKALGLALAVAGVALALLTGDQSGGSILGDVLGLMGAMCWAAIALTIRAGRLKGMAPEGQLLWQLLISGPLLLALSPLFGPLIRDLGPIHWAGLAFQILVVVSAGFVFWLWLLSIYPASGVASFAFLSPVFGVGLGWALMGDQVGPRLIAALALVAVGLVLVNRPQRPAGAQVPQKVRSIR
ncbi:MAG: DMT family transporter [Paracoccaceae bacterium]